MDLIWSTGIWWLSFKRNSSQDANLEVRWLERQLVTKNLWCCPLWYFYFVVQRAFVHF